MLGGPFGAAMLAGARANGPSLVRAAWPSAGQQAAEPANPSRRAWQARKHNRSSQARRKAVRSRLRPQSSAARHLVPVPQITMASAAAPSDAAAAAEAVPGGSLFGMISTLVGSPAPATPQRGSAPPGSASGASAEGATAAVAPKPLSTDAVQREFLLRLRHGEAGPVRAFLQSRLRQFATQDFAAAPARGAGSVEAQAQRLQSDILARMQKCHPWAKLDAAGWSQEAEAVERFVSSQLHDHVVKAAGAGRAADEAFGARCDALGTFVGPAELHVPQAAVAPRFKDTWATAQDFVHRVTAYKDPFRKLLCIDRCCRQLYRMIHTAGAVERAARLAAPAQLPDDEPAASSPAAGMDNVDTAAPGATRDSPAPAEEQSGPSADDLVPCVIWCLLRSNPPRFRSHLEFITRFRPPSRVSGSLAYHLTVLQSAVHFIESCGAAELGMSPEAFDEAMRAGEEAATSRQPLAKQLQSIGDSFDTPRDRAASGGAAADGAPDAAAAGSRSGEAAVSEEAGHGAAGTIPLASLAPLPMAHELPYSPPLSEATPAALEAWKADRYRFLRRDPASLTMAEVPQLLEEYRHMVATCASIAEALGLPPPDVAVLRPGRPADAGEQAPDDSPP